MSQAPFATLGDMPRFYTNFLVWHLRTRAEERTYAPVFVFESDAAFLNRSRFYLRDCASGLLGPMSGLGRLKNT